jgi:hypothetical protein
MIIYEELKFSIFEAERVLSYFWPIILSLVMMENAILKYNFRLMMNLNLFHQNGKENIL